MSVALEPWRVSERVSGEGELQEKPMTKKECEQWHEWKKWVKYNGTGFNVQCSMCTLDTAHTFTLPLGVTMWTLSQLNTTPSFFLLPSSSQMYTQHEMRRALSLGQVK